jgi:hypothetical protein
MPINLPELELPSTGFLHWHRHTRIYELRILHSHDNNSACSLISQASLVTPHHRAAVSGCASKLLFSLYIPVFPHRCPIHVKQILPIPFSHLLKFAGRRAAHPIVLDYCFRSEWLTEARTLHLLEATPLQHLLTYLPPHTPLRSGLRPWYPPPKTVTHLLGVVAELQVDTR